MAIQNAVNLTATGLVAHDGAGVFTGRTLTGDTDHIDVANADGTAGNPTLTISEHFDDTGMHGWNGAPLEDIDVDVTSDGATITFSIQKTGTGNLTIVFSDEFYAWTTAPATVALTAGTDTVPVLNYVYLLQSNKTLTVSTVGWPATEHCPLATVLCQSAASLQTDLPYKLHVWKNSIINANSMGHLDDLSYWIRNQHATWLSGSAQTFTITANGGAADNVIITLASGVVIQLHDHTFPAFAGTPDLYTVNDSATAYNKVTDMNALLTDSTGASMSGKYFSLVLWGVVSENSGDCKLMVNLPGGSYNSASMVTDDPSKYAVFDIPAAFKGTGFLIAQWNLRHQTGSSGTWTSIDEIDLRGFFPSTTRGGVTSVPSEFVDNAFRIIDDGDATKEIAFQASGISTATTRTITMDDANVDLSPNDGTYAAAAGGTQIVTVGTVATGTWQATDVGVAYGGTGVSTFASNGVLYGNAATSVLVTAQGAANSVLTANAGAPSFSATPTVTTMNATTFDTNIAAAGVTLAGTTLAADGSDTNIDVSITPKGTGVTLTEKIGFAADTTAILIESSGIITFPLQSAFRAYISATATNVTGDSTDYVLAANTEVYDLNSDYNTGTFTFTAPTTAHYTFEIGSNAQQVGAGHTKYFIELLATGQTYTPMQINPGPALVSTLTHNNSLTIPMTAADTATVELELQGSTKTVDFLGANISNTGWSGYLAF